MFSVDDYLDKQYDFSRYNCSHFVNEIWLALTGESINGICQSFVSNDNRDFPNRLRERIRLAQAISPCVVIIHSDFNVPHAGVYYDGRVLHLTDCGARYELLDTLRTLGKLSFYK